MMIIENKFNIGETVYLITDPDQHKRIVTEIRVRRGCVLYEVGFSDGSCISEEFEITKEKVIV